MSEESERRGGRKRSEQSGASERVSGVRERVNRRASGPVFQSVFLVILAHSAVRKTPLHSPEVDLLICLHLLQPPSTSGCGEKKLSQHIRSSKRDSRKPQKVETLSTGAKRQVNVLVLAVAGNRFVKNCFESFKKEY